MRVSIKVAVLLFFSLLLTAYPAQVKAQSGSPEDIAPPTTPTAAPADQPVDIPKGVITGKVINQNDPSKLTSDLDVMLHVLDQNMNQLGMLHGKSIQDGSFTIEDVPFQVGMAYAAAVVYQETTYYSQIAPAEDGITSLNLDVPVYESTTDLSNVKVDQMHVLFSFAEDGMELKELYVLSNKGDRTVKGGVDVPGNDGVKAAVRFVLPEKADFINFQPQAEGRFLKFPGGFADMASIVPGEMVSQFLVGYLLPYSKPLTYRLKTTLAVQQVSFVLPADSGVSLKGDGLGAAEPTAAQDGQLYNLYKLENIPAGQTFELTVEGEPNIPDSQVDETTSTKTIPFQLPLFLGLGVVGVALIGGGAFWWVRSSRNEVEDGEEDVDAGETGQTVQEEFESLLTEISQLDQYYEQGEIDKETYQDKRASLLTRAKAAHREMTELPEEENQSSN